MIIWRGWGILALPIFMIIGLLGAESNSNQLIAIRLAISAILIWYFGKYLNDKPGRILIDPKNNETVEIKSTHDLFWIKMEYWAVPIFFAALYFLFL